MQPEKQVAQTPNSPAQAPSKEVKQSPMMLITALKEAQEEIAKQQETRIWHRARSSASNYAFELMSVHDRSGRREKHVPKTPML